MKTKSKISGHIIRGGAWAVFLSVAFIAATSAFDSPWWQVDNFPTTQGRVKILLQEDRSITDESDANFTVQRP